MNIHPNQTAFPCAISESPLSLDQPGLTKREYFAGLAMQGLEAASSTGTWTPEEIAKYACECADALIKELNK